MNIEFSSVGYIVYACIIYKLLDKIIILEKLLDHETE